MLAWRDRHAALRLVDVGRRDFLKQSAALSLAASALSWTDVIAARAEDLRSRGMACILLWMSGGPSQFETFSPKPGHANGGETKAIDTSVAGIQIAANGRVPNFEVLFQIIVRDWPGLIFAALIVGAVYMRLRVKF